MPKKSDSEGPTARITSGSEVCALSGPTTAPTAAAVVSEESVAPMKVPWFQSRACVTSGTLVARRPPNKMAEIGTPRGSSHSGAIDGHCEAGTVNRALGCDAGVVDSGVHG